MTDKIKIGFFFGAGAEMSYGMPSGGQFAINIFKRSVDIYKKRFKQDLLKIDQSCIYARNWLPLDFQKKPIYAFGKSEYGSILQSSIEYKNEQIGKKLTELDEICEKILDKNKIRICDFQTCYKNIFKKEFGETTYANTVILNKKLIANINESIFNSTFYSMLLDYIKIKTNSYLKIYASAILQLYVCYIGQNIVKDLNQEMFEKNETELSIFDDISNIFSMNFTSLGTSIFNIVIDKQFDELNSVDENNFEIFLEKLFYLVLIDIFSASLDYRKLIDEHFRYLYTPQIDWPKFTRINIFLRIAKDYIEESETSIIKKINDDTYDEGYYDDLINFPDNIIFNIFGTSNYTNILTKILHNKIKKDCCKIHFLNGNTKYFYNPYKNSIIEIDSNNYVFDGQIVVPFILTQSGLKPITSITMSEEYVSLYNNYKKSDCIVCIGFGFNSDDSHINGIFRQLIEEDKKHLIYITIDEPKIEIEKLQKNIRLSYEAIKRIHVLKVDSNRYYIENKTKKKWTYYVEKKAKEIKNDVIQ